MRIETIAVHAGAAGEPAGDVTPAIHVSTTFERDADGGYSRGYSYQRKANPNRTALEAAMRALEGGEEAIAFASGSAGIAAIFQAIEPRSRVVAHRDSYYGSRVILDECAHAFGHEIVWADLSDPSAVADAVVPGTRVVWVETPSNPMLRVTDVEAVSSASRAAGALCVCDNTLATPALMRPFELGADVVVHATTKYVAGHSDASGGMVVFRAHAELADRVRHLQHVLGAVPSPFDCWLTLRGLKTLPYRVRAHSANALRVAEFLASDTHVSVVHYPGLPSHPGHATAARQMRGFGGVLSFECRGGAAAAMAVAASCRLFTRATSFGGVESLIEHRASIEGPGTDVPAALLRASIGLEHPDDLIADLIHALAQP
jgi:cystathionine gamma-synthase